MSRIITIILFVLLTVSCATQRQDDLIVLGAGLSHASEHSALQRSVANSPPKTIDKQFVITGHRISEGKGVVLAIRKFSSGIAFRTDQAAFQKITIYLPLSKPHGRINLSETEGVVAYLSSGSSNFPGTSGCYGYAYDGTLDFLKETNDKVTVFINIMFNLFSPRGWTKECGPLSVQETLTFDKRAVSSLTPWEGRAGKHVYDEILR